MTSNLEADWQRFHDANPRVWELFVRFAFEAIAAGHKRYSSDAILHRIRWHTSVETKGGDFKLNDHHTAYYARLFLERYQQYPDFFETRERRSEAA